MGAVTLTEFLLSRFAEDAGLAEEAMDPRFAGGGYGLALGHRALADIEAKRRIVELASYWMRPVEGLDGEDILTTLALPYADHPDFRKEWQA